MTRTQTLFVFGLSVVCCVGSAQSGQSKVTYAGPAKRVRALMADLSKAAGIRLEASEAFKNEPLLVCVKEVDLSDLMSKVATATTGKWEKIDGGFRLNLDTTVAAKQEKDTLEERTKLIRSRLDELIKRHSASGEWNAQSLVDEERKRRQDMISRLQKDNPNAGADTFFNISTAGGQTGRSPAELALYTLLTDINATDLASVKPGEKAVFSTNPTQMQRRANFSWQKAISQFVKTHNQIADAVAQNGAAESTNVRFSGGLDLSGQRINGGLGKALLIVSRFSQDGPINVELKMADLQGLVVGKAQVGIDLSMPFVRPTVAGTTTENPIKLSAISKELLKLVAGGSIAGAPQRSQQIAIATTSSGVMSFSTGDESETKQLSPELQTFLSDPEKSDPMSLFVSEPFVATANNSNLNIVAVFSDSTFIKMARYLANGNITPSQTLTLAENSDLKVYQAPNWAVVTPSRPFGTRASRTSRGDLARFEKTVLVRGYATLDEMAAYSQVSPRSWPARDAIDNIYLRILLPETGTSFESLRQTAGGMLEFYATLTYLQKQTLDRGGSVSLASLMPNQVTYANKIVFGAGSGGGIMIGPGGGTSVSITASRGSGSLPGMGAETIFSERTEALPFGIPRSGTLSISSGTTPGVFSKKASSRDGKFFTAGDYGFFKSFSGSLNSDDQASSKKEEYLKFKEAEIANITLTFNLTDQMRESRQLKNGWVLPTATEMTFAQLPESFRNGVKAAENQAKPGGIRFSVGGGGAVKPPPPGLK